MRSIQFARSASVAALLSLGLIGATVTPAHADYSASPRTGWGANNTVYAVDVTADRTYIAGAFGRIIGPDGQLLVRSKVAAFDRSTGAPISSFQVTLDGTVRSMEVAADGTVFLGGSFTTINGFAQPRLAAVTSTGTLVSGWAPVVTSGAVRDLALVGGSLFVAGTFGKISGKARGGLAKVNPDTGAVEAWRATPAGGKAWTLTPAPNGTDLLVGGAFTSIAGVARPGLAAVALSNAALSSWSPAAVCDGCEIYDLAVADGDVFGALGGPGGRGVRWSSATGELLWLLKGDGNAQAIGVRDGIVYLGGHFGFLGGQVRSQIAALDADTGALLPWLPDLGVDTYPGVWVITTDDDHLRVGGGFRTVNGGRPARFAEFPVT